jgi:hypothetical protein
MAAGVLLVLFLFGSVHVGGHVMGPTYIAAGNVGLVIDNRSGRVERSLMSAGTHWQGPWETVIEVPTAQRTINLTNAPGETGNGVQVNTMSNMLEVDASAQYQIDPARARDLYKAYQDQFADLHRFELVNLEPSVKGAINYAIGDIDTATALTTVGKQRAEKDALKTLNAEWAPRGIVFSNLMIRGINQDEATKALLATTLQKLQQIDNARLALQQQQYENATLLQAAKAEARVNQLENSTLTDLYLQDQVLGQVKRLYLPADEVMGMLSK